MFRKLIGGLDDVCPRAIILRQNDNLRSWILFGEFQKVTNIATAPAVYCLEVITDSPYLRTPGDLEVNQCILRKVDILIFVYQNMRKLPSKATSFSCIFC